MTFWQKNLSVVLFDIINNVSGVIRGLNSTPHHVKKSFLGVEPFYKGFNLPTSPLKYSPGGRPLGMGDPGNGGPIPDCCIHF